MLVTNTVRNPNEIYFLVTCPICKSDMTPKKRIEGEVKKQIVSKDLVLRSDFEKGKITEYTQSCPHCSFKMLYLNRVEKKNNIREINNIKTINKNKMELIK